MSAIRPTLNIKNTIFGLGIPKICLPEVEESDEEILNVVESYEKLEGWQVLEVRLDYYKFLENDTKLIELLKNIRKITSRLVLATIRTIDEGGRIALGPDKYLSRIKILCESDAIDLVDIELTKGNSCVQEAIYIAHQNNVFTIISQHHFDFTPNNDYMKNTLRKMETVGGDILKLAVMPQNRADVLRLLEITNEISGSATKPLITMSMGSLGEITRVTGENYGSTMTFATAGKASAPGQIPLKEMIQTLNTLHND